MFKYFFLLFSLSLLSPSFSDTVEVTEGADIDVITEVSFGTEEDDDFPVIVYISPSCIHCGKFVVGDFKSFVKQHKHAHRIILRFLPTSAKDIFIMKIIQNEVKDADGFFIVFENYIKRCLATINHTNPTKEQEEKFKGSKVDPDMIKFQVIASDFGFSDKKIINAIPDVDEQYEIKLIKSYGEFVESISDTVDTKNIDLPLIMKGDKVLKTLNDAYENQ